MKVKEKAKMVREELKKIGYSSKMVSVKSGCTGYSDFIRITIKDLSCDKDKINAIALKFKSIDYDERSGEILAGGNTYISVFSA